MTDTPADRIPRHQFSFRVTPEQARAGVNARCIVCGACFAFLDDEDVLAPCHAAPPEKERG